MHTSIPTTITERKADMRRLGAILQYAARRAIGQGQAVPPEHARFTAVPRRVIGVRHLIAFAVLGIATVLTGCATYATPTGAVAYGFHSNAVTGAVTGAALGTVAGAVAGNPGAGAAIGGVVGALSGLSAGRYPAPSFPPSAYYGPLPPAFYYPPPVYYYPYYYHPYRYYHRHRRW